MNNNHSITPKHIPVLKKAVLKYALPDNAETFIDVTFGLGGHTFALLEKYPSLKYCLAIDKDEEILNYSCKLNSDNRIKRVCANASDLRAILALDGIEQVDGILMDMGISSYQLENSARGFSFMKPGPLDMRMNKNKPGITAFELVNETPKNELIKILREYGEEKFAPRIVKHIIRYRAQKTIKTTDELAQIITNAIPAAVKRKMKIHPATKTFQALRIVVNNELEELKKFLDIAFKCLKPGGHLTLISFHSLEDRIVKTFFNKYKKGCTCPPNFPVCICGKKAQLELLTKKPIIADNNEILKNPRARSAKLRAAKKI